MKLAWWGYMHCRGELSGSLLHRDQSCVATLAVLWRTPVPDISVLGHSWASLSFWFCMTFSRQFRVRASLKSAECEILQTGSWCTQQHCSTGCDMLRTNLGSAQKHVLDFAVASHSSHKQLILFDRLFTEVCTGFWTNTLRATAQESLIQVMHESTHTALCLWETHSDFYLQNWVIIFLQST